jgi:hypothetical protein
MLVPKPKKAFQSPGTQILGFMVVVMGSAFYFTVEVSFGGCGIRSGGAFI